MLGAIRAHKHVLVEKPRRGQFERNGCFSLQSPRWLLEARVGNPKSAAPLRPVNGPDYERWNMADA
jgi:hypothetical protein